MCVMASMGCILCLSVAASSLLVDCVMSQQHDSVFQRRICSDNFTCCRTEIEVADQTFCLTQSQYTDTGLTSLRADPMTPGAWQGNHRGANSEITGMTRPGIEPGVHLSRGGRLNHLANEAVAVSRQTVRACFNIPSPYTQVLPTTICCPVLVENDRHMCHSRYCSRQPPDWPCGYRVRLESGRSGVQFPLAPWIFFRVESHQ